MRILLTTYESQFTAWYSRAVALLGQVPEAKLYWQPRQSNVLPVYSCGEYLLRSAGAVEQLFGGLTAQLWDDPFEWTLPEALPTAAKIIEYLSETDATRQRGFALLTTDNALTKEVMTPWGVRTVAALLLQTLARTAYYEGCAAATLRLLTDARGPRP